LRPWRSWREKTGIIVTVLSLALVACGQEPAHEARPPEPPVARGVTVVTVAPVETEETVEALGTVNSKTTTTISSRVVGAVLAMHVREGSQVQAGAPLVELDDRDISTTVRRAEAALAEAQAAQTEVERAIAAAEAGRTAAEAQRDLAAATLKRYQQLLDRKSVAPLEYDQVVARHRAAAADVERAAAEVAALQAKRSQVQSRIEGARAEIARTQVTQSYTEITAPFSGLVTVKHVDVGAMAAPGTPLLTLEDNRHYRLEVSVPESQGSAIRLGQTLPVSVDAAGLSTRATVEEIVPGADPSTRTIQVRLDLPASPRLRSGLFGRAWIPVGHRSMLRVPEAAVLERGQLQGVYVVGQDGIARFRLIRTGAVRQGTVEVLSGLTPGEQVIVAGLEQVKDGSRIEDAKR
jgi:multidrug efflux pump subunit AcrA (membrane-fusion protein)